MSGHAPAAQPKGRQESDVFKPVRHSEIPLEMMEMIKFCDIYQFPSSLPTWITTPPCYARLSR